LQLGRGIRRRIRDFFFLKTLVRSPTTPFAVFVEKVADPFVSVLVDLIDWNGGAAVPPP
jgi:hypothetical protein